MRQLRGTWLDVLRFDHDRLVERRILARYEALLDEILERLDVENHATAVALARIPEKIRGFGHIKGHHIAVAQIEEERLLDAFRAERVPAQ